MKKIKVQNKFSTFGAILISAFFILLAGIFVYITIVDKSISFHTKAQVYGFIGALFIFIPMWFANIKTKEEYVSDLFLDVDSITLLYKFGTSQRTQKIYFNDIREVKVTLDANNVKTGNSFSLFCETRINIITNDGKYTTFTENPSASFTLCSYGFFLRFLSIAKCFPNFSYTVNGNAKAVKEDVKYYARYGKRLNFFKREMISLNQYPLAFRIVMFFLMLLIIGCIGTLIYLNVPSFVSNNDKIYVSYIENGYKYYQNDNYKQSMLEYDKALNIHDNDSTLYYYRALTYYYDKKYEKSLDEAKRGISVLSEKSVYSRAKNYKFIKNDIGLYTTYGESALKLKLYSDAKVAFDYVINHVKYKYTDAYFYRGMSEYYLGEKENAIKDFLKHREIITNYFADQAGSEYKDVYPRYTKKNLKNVDKWIEACKVMKY